MSIHRVVAFRQEPRLKPYDKLNTKMRQQAKTDFEKDFFKLMVNGFFGKSMENVSKRRKVDLVSDTVKLKKLLARHQLEQFVIVNEEVKLLMFDFHYNQTWANYTPSCNFITNYQLLSYM
jgi:hypothetical protein